VSIKALLETKTAIDATVGFMVCPSSNSTHHPSQLNRFSYNFPAKSKTGLRRPMEVSSIFVALYFVVAASSIMAFMALNVSR